jgi:hypothetical protein
MLHSSDEVLNFEKQVPYNTQTTASRQQSSLTPAFTETKKFSGEVV